MNGEDEVAQLEAYDEIRQNEKFAKESFKKAEDDKEIQNLKKIMREECEKEIKKGEMAENICKADVYFWMLFSFRCRSIETGCGKPICDKHMSKLKFCECIDSERID